MAVPVEINNLMLGSVSGYQISRSVRFRSSATAYFNRTPASATNRTTWTWSGWVKRGSLSSQQALFSGGAGGNRTFLTFDSSNSFRLDGNGGTQRISTNVYRDLSAWYHVVWVMDTNNATAQNRTRIYVNSIEVTAWSTNTTISSGTTFDINTAALHTIGRDSESAIYYFDGYMTEVNFVDGQALTPSSFGEYDAITGVWKPKKYTGTYGTNGFYLNFSDNSAATAAAIGKDYSGNGNNWTPNNISVTAGTTYDSMIDTPTSFADGSTGRGNYATFNPLQTKSTLSQGNLLTTGLGGAGIFYSAAATIAIPSGQWYWEVTLVSATDGLTGIVETSQMIDVIRNTNYVGQTSRGYGYHPNGSKYNNGSSAVYGATHTTNDIIGVAFDADTRILSFYKNGTSQGTAFTVTAGYTYLPADSAYQSNSKAVNFGQRPFSYTPPSGFKALNTQNLPDATIKNGASYMAATLYTGNATVRSISNGGNNTIGTTFQPDFVWIKSRTPTAWSHELFDALRGPLNYLSTNLQAANQVEATSLTAFDSNGFSTGVWAPINGSGESLVAWQWNAGGSTVTNTSGSISAQVRANPTAGFSVITWTGTGANATVGHGLGVAPSMIINKPRGVVDNWISWHTTLGSTGYIYLNLTNASATAASVWNSTLPTSTVFSVGTSSNINSSGQTMVSYCFAAVAGY